MYICRAHQKYLLPGSRKISSWKVNMINITKAEEAFADYVRSYDPENGKVRLKIIHTYHVEKTAEKIAMELGLGEEDVLLAKLIGLLHDIGRFEIRLPQSHWL